ncbi:MAG: glycosyltransferase family 1 protein [Bacteroidales bacterium]|nr:glycosyltransferase family 1 protein [Bacteroidales bacterium]
MTKVLIDLLKLSNLNCGLGQVAYNFAETLSQTDSEFEKHFLVPKKFKGKFGNDVIYHTKLGLKSYLRKNKFDLWHCIHQEPEVLPKDDTKILMTIHDLNFLGEKSNEKAAKRLLKLQNIVDRTTQLAFISEYSKSIALQHLKTSNKICSVIYNGVTCCKNGTKPKFFDGGNFFFTIGVLKPKKNFEVLIPIMKIFPDTLLIIAGKKKGSYYKHLKRIVEKENLSNQIIFAGNISEEEKTWLYQNCKAFLFPSLYEGFGLPVIEAMLNGVPAIISNKTSLPEIGSDKAYYFDSFDSDAMADVIQKSIQHFNSSTEISKKNREYAEGFNWKENVAGYSKLYLKIMQED